MNCFIAIALANIIKKVQENQVGVKLNREHQLFVFVGELNLPDDIATIKENTVVYWGALTMILLPCWNTFSLLSLHNFSNRNIYFKIMNNEMNIQGLSKRLGKFAVR
jgi:hypothetical protein